MEEDMEEEVSRQEVRRPGLAFRENGWERLRAGGVVGAYGG